MGDVCRDAENAFNFARHTLKLQHQFYTIRLPKGNSTQDSYNSPWVDSTLIHSETFKRAGAAWVCSPPSSNMPIVSGLRPLNNACPSEQPGPSPALAKEQPMNWLYFKHLLVRTPLERPAQYLRDLAGFPNRRRYPELHEIYVEQDRIEQAMRRIIQPDSNCIDIGCHIGSSLSLIMRSAPHGKHLAFEPVPEKAMWLSRKFPEVEVKPLALGEKREKLTFYQDTSRPGFSGFAKDLTSQDKVVELTVECDLLDNVVDAASSYAYVKIDVEGAELLVLKGARQIIARDRPVILFESSHDGAAKLGLRREDLFATFTEELGYEVFLLKDFLENRPPLTLNGFQQAAVYPFQAFNFLAVPKR